MILNWSEWTNTSSTVCARNGGIYFSCKAFGFGIRKVWILVPALLFIGCANSEQVTHILQPQFSHPLNVKSSTTYFIQHEYKVLSTRSSTYKCSINTSYLFGTDGISISKPLKCSITQQCGTIWKVSLFIFYRWQSEGQVSGSIDLLTQVHTDKEKQKGTWLFRQLW